MAWWTRWREAYSSAFDGEIVSGRIIPWVGVACGGWGGDTKGCSPHCTCWMKPIVASRLLGFHMCVLSCLVNVCVGGEGGGATVTVAFCLLGFYRCVASSSVCVWCRWGGGGRPSVRVSILYVSVRLFISSTSKEHPPRSLLPSPPSLPAVCACVCVCGVCTLRCSPSHLFISIEY